MKPVRKKIKKSAKSAPSTARKSAPAENKKGNVSAMWAGRFSQGMSSSMERLSVSLSFDKKLFREDIEGSMAHAYGLHAAGVLTAPEREKMIAGLQSVL